MSEMTSIRYDINSFHCISALVSVALANFFAISFNILGLIVLIVGVIVLSLLSSFAACEDSPLKSRIMVSVLLFHTCTYIFYPNEN